MITKKQIEFINKYLFNPVAEQKTYTGNSLRLLDTVKAGKQLIRTIEELIEKITKLRNECLDNGYWTMADLLDKILIEYNK